jgi:hypothetical protein
MVALSFGNIFLMSVYISHVYKTNSQAFEIAGDLGDGKRENAG